jgi:flagellar hook-associated protein 2
VNGGAEQTSSSNTIKDGIVGTTLTLKAQTASTTITVGAPGPDSDAVTAKIKGFIDQYNSTIDFIQGKLKEQKVVNPTTDDDRAKGVLASDPGLSQLLSKLRTAVADIVSGRPAATQTLSQVGLSTGKTTGGGSVNQDAVAGKLTLDETMLTDQLAAHFSDVKALFTNITGSYATEGLAQRLSDNLATYTSANGILASRIASEDSLISSYKKRSADLDVRLDEREKALRAKFTAMETALSQAQQQGNWLAGQLSGL